MANIHFKVYHIIQHLLKGICTLGLIIGMGTCQKVVGRNFRLILLMMWSVIPGLSWMDQSQAGWGRKILFLVPATNVSFVLTIWQQALTKRPCQTITTFVQNFNSLTNSIGYTDKRVDLGSWASIVDSAMRRGWQQEGEAEWHPHL